MALDYIFISSQMPCQKHGYNTRVHSNENTVVFSFLIVFKLRISPKILDFSLGPLYI